ncbi:MAG: hypothetical protein NVS4B3_00750 [Gemmatimonadaceae bacterium]
MESERARAGAGWQAAAWSGAAAVALVAGAAWLRDASVVYLVTTGAATTGALVTVGRRRWRLATVAGLVAFVLSGALTARDDGRVRRSWPGVRDEIERGSIAALQQELEKQGGDLQRVAARALDVPAGPDAFAVLASLLGRSGDRGVVVYRDSVPTAWAGTVRVPTDSLHAPIGIAFSPFYAVLFASAERGSTRAVATLVAHARPPADRLSHPLDADVARRFGLRRFALTASAALLPGDDRTVISGAGQPLAVVRALPLDASEVRERGLQRGRVRGGIALTLAVLFFLAAVWQGAPLAGRLAALSAVFLTIGAAPLNSYSNAGRVFDPSIYFTAVGGAWTANVAALALSSTIVLLGVLALLRGRVGYPSRGMALGILLGLAGGAPYVLRHLAGGIVVPLAGVSGAVWLAWEVAIFLAAVSIVLAGVTAGREALGERRGITPLAGPVTALGAAFIGPLAWQAPGSWPAWYPLVWVAAVVMLALARRTRRILVASSFVAALGAAVLVWAVTARARVDLAERDVAGLTVIDRNAEILLARFGQELRGSPPPSTRSELVRAYSWSNLGDAGYPVSLALWAPAALKPHIILDVTTFHDDSGAAAVQVAEARRLRAPVAGPVAGPVGRELVLAVPYRDGTVVTVTVAPNTRLIASDPLAGILGLAPPDDVAPPYVLAITDAAGGAPLTPQPSWRRDGHALHGDWPVLTSRGRARVHAEIELRTVDALVQRGALVVLVDLALVLVLWLVGAAADGGVGRWLGMRRRQWARSYRAQLVFGLFAFFIVPAAAFAMWSYRQLLRDDLQARALVATEALRGAPPLTADLTAPGTVRPATPVLQFAGGEISAVTDSLYVAIAPLGRFLPPDIYRQLGLANEVTASEIVHAGALRALIGYRAARAVGGARIVLATPARPSDAGVDRRRRDLGTLVLFATVCGAVAALWLSGVAARQLARPINALRGAALAIAGGEREPLLRGAAPAEFTPVFDAFRRMAADLSASRLALEEAQRRTAAVLRNVASGVVAVNAEGYVTLANPRAEAILRRTLAAGIDADALGHVELASRVRAVARGDTEEDELDAAIGARRLHVRVTRLARGGAVVTLDDVSELARAQRVLAWGEMARQVAHEIKNPLTPIRLGVQHLRRSHAAKRPDFDVILEQNVQRILAEIDRLDEIARAFSRYGSSPEERAPAVPVDVAAVVRGTIELEAMGEGAIMWDAQGVDGVVRALARDTELREVVLNLLENARLAGARRVTATLVETDKKVEIVVDDDGEGIAPDLLPQIFEPHFSTRTSGSGLGLAISRRLIEGWGGKVGVVSGPGPGTRVTVSLVRA